MDRHTAEQLMGAVRQLDAVLAEIGSIADALANEAQQKQIKRLAAGIILDVHEGISLEVAKQYPDLHPDRA